jgi:hypothetical protein
MGSPGQAKPTFRPSLGHRLPGQAGGYYICAASPVSFWIGNAQESEASHFPPGLPAELSLPIRFLGQRGQFFLAELQHLVLESLLFIGKTEFHHSSILDSKARGNARPFV